MLINKQAVRDFIREKMLVLRPHLAEKFTRISESTFDRYNALLSNMIEQDIRQHPTIGKTFNP